MGLTRRHFLRAGSATLLCACARPGVSLSDADVTHVFSGGGAGEPLLAVIFLRGGADGLQLVPPVGERAYGSLRGSLALSAPLPFQTGFGLHPALESLLPLAERGEFAVVHAVGSPHPSRSHFEAQDFMEAGEPGSSDLHDGWLARALAGVAEEDAFASLAIAAQLPLSLRGAGSFAMTDVDEFGVAAGSEARAALERLYAGAEDDPVVLAGRRALGAVADLERRVGSRRSSRRRGGGRGPRRAGERLVESVEQLLVVERAGLAVQAVCLESGGWDTHVNQGVEAGQMAGWIRDLAEAVARLDAGLRGRRELRLVVMTEFGRTVRPNGSRGTDHGHGSVMLVAGSGVRGGLHGDWRGLEDSALYEGRDLAVTTDWRSVLHEVMTAHLGKHPPADTFPGYAPRSLGLFA
ncbi:MAG: DUF1501 domain-containing protein [Myxococcota bacterium]|jgi:uncharacterized protein (DUF1501 family)|nr:DUF1501 domain-containing protein [bacterium]MDP7076113.1 DUF1501 domain-containing protein [Myxococcota bacterium]MDP7301060.1 DUF1501 domain-containing protein [Myxococcota bacterium]MDP7433875.1 DUF1501 domain-containing protein [Myxococcota bacterium]HJO24923.1 DUF1501 domain-containing protein [Myxococcota bacterium]